MIKTELILIMHARQGWPLADQIRQKAPEAWASLACVCTFEGHAEFEVRCTATWHPSHAALRVLKGMRSQPIKRKSQGIVKPAGEATCVALATCLEVGAEQVTIACQHMLALP